MLYDLHEKVERLWKQDIDKRERNEASFNERDENDLIFGTFTVTGYFFINIVLLIGILTKDDSKIIVI